MYDLNVSHVGSNVVYGVINKLDEKYGKEAPLTIAQGKTHKYLGMTIDFSSEGKLIIRMDK